jgi:alkylation response protein AidB-like acyl-CoA dehydrogenase
MDFAFSQEQEMLRASARAFLEERYPIDRMAAMADADGFPREEWRSVAELGWPGISIPEDQGGAGLGFVEEMILCEELGRAVFPGPFLATVVLALPALRAAGPAASELVATIASGDRTATLAWAGSDGSFDTDPAPKVSWDGERLTATRLFVPHLAVADVVVVVGAPAGGTGLWAVDQNGDGVSWREHPTIDTTRPVGELTVTQAQPLLAAAPEDGWLEGVRDRALVALAAEAVGAASGALDLAVTYARTREQFGRPIGTFQAVAHELAQAFMEIETARSLVYWAGWAVQERAPEAATAAAAAKARAADAATDACERAIQVHGGVGFTWEHPLHRYYRRALGISFTLGTGEELRARVGSALVEGPAAPTIEAT